MAAGKPRNQLASEVFDESLENTFKTVVKKDTNVIALQEKLTELKIKFNEDDDLTTLVTLLTAYKPTLNPNDFDNYAPSTYLKNRELVKRCYDLGITAFFISPIQDPKRPDGAPVYVFSDNDAHLDNAQLLEKVRFCGFTQVDFQQVMTKYSKQPKPQRMR